MDTPSSNEVVDGTTGLDETIFASFEQVIDYTFQSEAEAYVWFNQYAKHMGFSIRRHIVRREKGRIQFLAFVCSKHGMRELKHMEREEFKRGPRPLSRTGCPVEFAIRYDKNAQLYRVAHFVNDHNHDVAFKDGIPFLRSQRHIDEGMHKEMNDMIDAGSRKHKVRDFLELKAGGYQNLGFVARDIYNKTYRASKKLIEKGDANYVLQQMRIRKEKDPDFFYEYETDMLHRLKHLFWPDGQSIFDYAAFGDVVMFDSTYRTNKYGMPFVPFVGVNHHRRTVLFGCGILSDETVSAFRWLLRSFMRAHKHKAPISIVTDRDNLMRRAITTILPGTQHRLCAWHLARNVFSNFHNHELINKVVQMIFKVYSYDAFEREWVEMIHKHNVVTNKWLTELYSKRETWAETYLHDRIFLGIRSTQRSEGMNSRFRSYLARGMTLKDLVHHYDRCVTRMRVNEAEDDFKSSQTVEFTRLDASPLQKHAARCYTETLFRIVDLELQKSRDLDIIFVEPISTSVIRYTIGKRGEDISPREVKYTRNESQTTMTRSCAKLDSQGIPCRHIFIVLEQIGQVEIPTGCIWVRWTKHAKLGIQSSRHAGLIDNSKERIRLQELNSLGMNVFSSSSKNKKEFMEVKAFLKSRMLSITGAAKSQNINVGLPSEEVDGNEQGDIESVFDPERAKTKGAPKKRLKSFIEKRTYRCSYCHEKGHTRRTCPMVPTFTTAEGVGENDAIPAENNSPQMSPMRKSLASGSEGI